MTLDPRIEAAARILAMWSDDTARHTIDVIARNALAAADAVDPLRVAVADHLAAIDALDDAETGGTTAEINRADRRAVAAYRALVAVTR